MITMTRAQYPVGQGCFHAGRIAWEDCPTHPAGTFHYVYDCGSTSKRKILDSAISAFSSMVSRDRTHDVAKIDALYVSHLDADHVKGLDTLLNGKHSAKGKSGRKSAKEKRVRAETVLLPYLSDFAKLANFLADAQNTAPSELSIKVCLDPVAWFRDRGATNVVQVLSAPPEEGPGGDHDIPEGLLEREPENPWWPSEPDGSSAASPVIKSGQTLSPQAIPDLPEWVWVPHVTPQDETKLKEFKKAVIAKFGLPQSPSIDSEWLRNAMTDDSELRALRKCYTDTFQGTHNRVSMSLYSGPKSWSPERHSYYDYRVYPPRCDCFCMYPNPSIGWIGAGDAELRPDTPLAVTIVKAWQETYKPYRQCVHTLLLPHHGSSKNCDARLLEFVCPIRCVVSAADSSQYGHPGVDVVQTAIQSGANLYHVSEKPSTMFCEVIRFP